MKMVKLLWVVTTLCYRGCLLLVNNRVCVGGNSRVLIVYLITIYCASTLSWTRMKQNRKGHGAKESAHKF